MISRAFTQWSTTTFKLRRTAERALWELARLNRRDALKNIRAHKILFLSRSISSQICVFNFLSHSHSVEWPSEAENNNKHYINWNVYQDYCQSLLLLTSFSITFRKTLGSEIYFHFFDLVSVSYLRFLNQAEKICEMFRDILCFDELI